MDLVEQIVTGIVRRALPQGATLAELHPLNEGRIDVLVSHGLAHVISTTGNPLVNALYQAARPMVDGALVSACGPVALAGQPKRLRKPSSTAVVKRRKKPVERTREGVEILDAEFVDMPDEVRK